MKFRIMMFLFLMIAVSLTGSTLILNYHRYDKDYTGWGLHLWGSGYAGQQVDWGNALTPTRVTDYGAQWEIPYSGEGDIQFIIHKGDLKDPDGDRTYPNPQQNQTIWTITQDPTAYTTLEEAKANATDLTPINPDKANHRVRLHYLRFDKQYDNWGLHVWGTGYDGTTVNWSSPLSPDHASENEVSWDIPYKGAGTLNFIIHKGDTKDVEADRLIPSPATLKDAYVVTGDPIVYTNKDELKKAGANKVLRAMITGMREVTVTFRFAPKEPVVLLYKQTPVKLDSVESGKLGQMKLTTTEKLHLSGTYLVQCGEMSIEPRVDWHVLDTAYAYDGELGCAYRSDETEFRLWAPLASAVMVNLYHQGEDAVPYTRVALQRGDKGVWHLLMKENLLGVFYNYSVINQGTEKTVLDPYAFSMAAFTDDGTDTVGKAAILNPEFIGPPLSHAEIAGYSKREDAVIYEVHVRDFTSDGYIKTTAPFGTYSAFIEKLDYLKSLGVTHIQLLPIMNYYYGNEMKNREREVDYATQKCNYNWGYDPHNYFTPEGMYSANPAAPADRVLELKRLIGEIHKRGMGVILDAVYNHTARLSILEDIVPNYYHFMDQDGTPKQSYGGGRVGTTHHMTRKLILDSIDYWVHEYKVDGFRFDLMGDMDAETVQKAYDSARQMNPNLLFLGEGWRTYTGDDGDKRMAADQDWMSQTHSAACFSDEFRNEMKSGFGSEGQPRFITGGSRDIATIFRNICGKPGNMKCDEPGDVVQYLEAHDNLTLHDVIAVACKLDPDVAAQEQEIQQRIRLGNAMLLTSQGVVFLHAGQEYGRTKQWRADTKPQSSFVMASGFRYPYFIENTYDASDALNHLDWAKMTQPGIYRDTRDYTSGLIRLRKSSDAFRLGMEQMIASNITLIPYQEARNNDVAIAYRCEATNGTQFYVFVNGDRQKRIFSTQLNLKSAEVVVDSDEAGPVPVQKISGVKIRGGNTIELDPLTVVILRKQGK